MSTDSPLSSTDLPTTSSIASSSSASTSATSPNWSQYGNGNNVGDDLMTLRKRCVPNSVENNQDQNQNPLIDMDAKDNNSNSNLCNAFTNSSEIDRMGDGGNDEGLSSNSNNFNIAITSSTAYSFPGSALGSDGVANLKDKLPNTTTTASSSNNTNNNSTKTDDSTTNNTTSNGTNNPNSSSNDDKQDDSMYECNICLDTAKDAVVSMCGHLFCWPCLHQWLETRPNRMLCPVCKAAISKDKVIPLYGRNSSKQEDPRNKVPPRPAGQRTEPEPHTGFQGFGFGDGFHMSFGIGAFPFGYFASSFNFGEPRPGPANRGTAHYEDEQQLSKLFLYLAFLCIAWLLFA